ncbi:MAG TPA: hypothetical protein VFU46_05165 [Gemmatimonadales bacterium]|nr:hypothetical protein [Gemmatimonadales bacterium]
MTHPATQAPLATPLVTPRRTLEQALGPIHERWMEEVHRALDPGMARRASLWDRWTATRYLIDQFDLRLRHEYALLESLLPLLPPAEAARLAAGRQDLERIRAELDELGRRRGTGPRVAMLLAEFRRVFTTWCAEIELAVAPLACDDLPAESRRLLEEYEAASAPP